MVDPRTPTDTFGDLPDALVQELLSAASPVAEEVKQRVDTLREARDLLRARAEQKRLIRRKADLDVPPEPSTVGVDGSYQVHRLTALDLCAAAAVGVEGTVKEACRHWPEPHHRMWVGGVPHHGQTLRVLRGLMVAMELNLAAEAPHDLVLLDGSFASLIIYINQGVSTLKDVDPHLAQALKPRWEDGTLCRALLALLGSDRTAAVPKFTSHNELATQAGIEAPAKPDGKTLATLILEAGEYTQPLSIDHPPNPYHLPPPSDNRLLNDAMRGLRVCYFRPYGWTPAIRLEICAAVANSATRLAILLEGITRQFLTPAVQEPYPLFLADRMVKSLGSGLQVVEQNVAQHIAQDALAVETTLLFLQNYRTEGGRGDVQ
jgi:hypothetical protein